MKVSINLFAAPMRATAIAFFLLWFMPQPLAHAKVNMNAYASPGQEDKDQEKKTKDTKAKPTQQKTQPANNQPGATPNSPVQNSQPGAAQPTAPQPKPAQPGTIQTKPTPYVPGGPTNGQTPVSPRTQPTNQVPVNPRPEPANQTPTTGYRENGYQPRVNNPPAPIVRKPEPVAQNSCPADPEPGTSSGVTHPQPTSIPGPTPRTPDGRPVAGQSSRAPGGTQFESTKPIILPPVSTKFPQSDFHFADRPPIKFVPFPLLDPDTKKKVSPDAMIRLPDGKEAPAGQVYDELNSYEQFLNEHGQTLRRPVDNTVIKVGSLDMNEELLRKQVEESPKPTNLPQRDLLGEYSAARIATPVTLHIGPSELAEIQKRSPLSPRELAAEVDKLNHSCLRGNVINGGFVNAATLSALAPLTFSLKQVAHPNPLACQPINDSKNWNWNLGTPSHFNAYLDGTVSFTGQVCEPPDLTHFSVNNHSQFSTSLEAKAGGYVFNHGGDILRVTGNANANGISNTVSANFDAYVLGNSVYSYNYGPSATWNYDHDFTIANIDESTSTTFMAGPVPIQLTIGFQAEAGVHLSLNLYPTYVAVTAGPYVNSSVYGQAAVNLLVVQAGIGVNLVLENYDVNIMGVAGIHYRATDGGYKLQTAVYANANLNLLSGNVYVFLKGHEPCKDWRHLYWCPFEDDYTIWSWPGMQYNHVIFDDESDNPLGW